MSYARMGRDSDVYIYLDYQGYLCCCACRLTINHGFERFGTTDALLSHLEKHEKAGHKVPPYAYEGLRDAAAENDAWMAEVGR